MIENLKPNKESRKSDKKLNLYPLKFEEVVKALLETQPKPKDNSIASQKQEKSK